MDYITPGSSVHGILQARIVEKVAISFPRGTSQPRDRTRVSCIADQFFTDIAVVQVKADSNLDVCRDGEMWAY